MRLRDRAALLKNFVFFIDWEKWDLLFGPVYKIKQLFVIVTVLVCTVMGSAVAERNGNSLVFRIHNDCGQFLAELCQMTRSLGEYVSVDHPSPRQNMPANENALWIAFKFIPINPPITKNELIGLKYRSKHSLVFWSNIPGPSFSSRNVGLGTNKSVFRKPVWRLTYEEHLNCLNAECCAAIDKRCVKNPVLSVRRGISESSELSSGETDKCPLYGRERFVAKVEQLIRKDSVNSYEQQRQYLNDDLKYFPLLVSVYHLGSYVFLRFLEFEARP